MIGLKRKYCEYRDCDLCGEEKVEYYRKILKELEVEKSKKLQEYEVCARLHLNCSCLYEGDNIQMCQNCRDWDHDWTTYREFEERYEYLRSWYLNAIFDIMGYEELSRANYFGYDDADMDFDDIRNKETIDNERTKRAISHRK